MRTGEPAFYPEDIKLPLMMITAADLCVNFVCYLIMFLMRARLDIGYYLLHIILPEAVYTIVVAFIFIRCFCCCTNGSGVRIEGVQNNC